MLPISLILKELENPTSVVPLLRELRRNNAHLSSSSKVDLKHLTSRTLNLCKANDPYRVWCGVNIVCVLIKNADVLSSFGSQFFAQLLKVLQGQKDRKVFLCTVDCLNKLSSIIRGKPTLTREILTPNLSALLSLYLDNLLVEPALMNVSMRVLVEKHPTTSRPFANKIRTKLLEFVASGAFLNCPEAVQKTAASLLATLPIVEKDGPAEFWNRDVQRIIANIAGTMKIFESFLQIKDDEDTAKLLLRMSSLEDDIFGLLHIDVNQPMSILTIANRIELLLVLLRGYITTATQFSVSVPLGLVISVSELICSINTKFMAFKREIRDTDVKEMVNITLQRCHHAAVKLLGSLPARYSGFIVTHLTNVLSFLELTIFLNAKNLDYARILEEEEYACELLRCVSSYVGLVGHLEDHTLLIRFVELAIFLIEPRKKTAQPNETKASLHSKSSRKRAKNGSTPLADILSHEHLFVEIVPESTRKTVFEFFTTVIPRVILAPTQYNKLVKAVMVEAVRLKDHIVGETVPTELKRILTAIVLNPAPESASILPIASTIMWDDELLSVLNNPRFPQLPVKIRSVEPEEDSDEEIETAEEPELKKRRLDDAQPQRSLQDLEHKTELFTNQADAFTQAKKEPENDMRESNEHFKKEEQNSLTEEGVKESASKEEIIGELETATEVDNVPAPEIQVTENIYKSALTEVPSEEGLDDGSDIEIPDLDLEESDDEE